MRPIKHPWKRAGLAIETLEPREMMAGNVLVSMSTRDLVVRGDQLDNQVDIFQPSRGTIRVQGLEGTTVNGQEFWDVAGLASNLSIRLQQGGADQVSLLGGLKILGDLNVKMNAGALTIDGSSGRVRIGEDLKIQSGPDGNVTIRNNVRIDGKTTIDAGGAVHVVAGQAALPDYRAASFSDSLNIDNPYFPAVIGTTYTYEVLETDASGNDVVTEMIVVEVLPQTRTIEGVETRVVRDRVWRHGLLIEDTFDWYAQDDNGNVWYFGEDVTNLEYDAQGNLIGTNKGGSWETGVNEAKAGVIMEADPRVGHNYYQEFAPAVPQHPAVVLDQGKVLATDETITVPAGTFSSVVRTEDTTVVEPEALSNKFYAPGLGFIQEFHYDYLTGGVSENVRLVSAELNGQPVTELVPPEGFVGTNVTGPITAGVRLDDMANIRARGGVIVRGAEFSDSAKIASPSDIAAIETIFAERASFRSDQTISLRDFQAEDYVQIGSDGDVYIVDSIFEAAVSAQFGGGDNTFAVAGSEFHRLEADGGGGVNVFEDAGDNTIGRLILRRFRR